MLKAFGLASKGNTALKGQTHLNAMIVTEGQAYCT